MREFYVKRLEEQAEKEFELALRLDPNNEENKSSLINSYYISARPDEGLEAERRLFNRGPQLPYFLEKRMVKEAEPLARQAYQRDPGSVWKFVYQVLNRVAGKHKEDQRWSPDYARSAGIAAYHEPINRAHLRARRQE